VSNTVVGVIVSIDKSAGKTICAAHAVHRVRHRDVSNEHPLVIQRILSHLNTKNDEVVVHRAVPGITATVILLFISPTCWTTMVASRMRARISAGICATVRMLV
jgi:hypothetical protein